MSKKRSKHDDVPAEQKQFLEYCRSGELPKVSKRDPKLARLVDGNGITALMYAVSAGQAQSLQVLLQMAVQDFTNARAGDGKTALMHASSKGQLECLKMLLAVGADKDAQDNSGTTALMKAAQRGHVECVRVLLNAGANPGLTNLKGNIARELTSDAEIMNLFDAKRHPTSSSGEFESMLTAHGLVQELARLNSTISPAPKLVHEPSQQPLPPPPSQSQSLPQCPPPSPTPARTQNLLSPPTSSEQAPKQFAVMLRAAGLEYVGTVKRS